jgi:hypothetical protein
MRMTWRREFRWLLASIFLRWSFALIAEEITVAGCQTFHEAALVKPDPVFQTVECRS